MDFRVRRAVRNPVAGDTARAAEGCVPPEAVRAQLERLLSSSQFRYSERLSRFLKFAVEQALARNTDQLKESVLAIEIFDRQSTYDSRIDSVVRVEARRLREKLDKYYHAEGAGDPIVIELPKGTYVPVFSAVPNVPVEPVPRSRRPAQFRLRTVALFGLAGALAAVLLTWGIVSRGPGTVPALERLTSDSGLTFQPALSGDGRLVAYASDRAGGGALDIWVQQVPRGVPARLTESPADELEPAFSPDGTVIAFRQEGEQGGIYTVPALGGKTTLLASGGYRPRFSPDGRRVAYWAGERSFLTGKVFVVPAQGGEPVRVQPGFSYAAYPIWSPDGRHLLFVGAKGMLTGEPNADDWEWWVAPAAGGPAVSTSARKEFESRGLRAPEAGWAHRWIRPYGWTSSGHVIFSARSGSQTNTWRVAISTRDWQVRGPAEQLTFGAGRQDHPSMAADGSLVFTALSQKSDIWSVPLEQKTGRIGAPIRLTASPGDSNRPSISRDGNRLAFASNRTGSDQVWVKDLAANREAALTATPEEKDAVVISPDGSRVAFGYAPPLQQAISVLPFAGGTAARLCSDCGLPRTWMPGGEALLYQRHLSPPESLIAVVDPSGRTETLVRTSDRALYSPSVSADGRWLALVVRIPPNEHQVALVPLRDGKPAQREDWIAATEPGAWVDKPRWSASGQMLYYVSNRDGFVCLWAQRFNPAARKLVSEPTAVAHFHSGRVSMGAVFGLDVSVAENKIVFNLGEASGNIWLAPAPR